MTNSPATLLVVNGPNRGTRFELSPEGGAVVIGRSVGSQIRIDDTEVSRQHVCISFDGVRFHVADLKSANGTFLNSRRITESELSNGDTIRLGSTALTFLWSSSAHAPSVHQVTFVDDSRSEQHSAIVGSVAVRSLSGGGSSARAPEPEHSNLELLYRVAEELVRPTHTLESLLDRLLELTLSVVRADRGCVLLREAVGAELTPLVFRSRVTGTGVSERMTVSRSITGYVLQTGQAVRTSDALRDARFESGRSIVTSGIREAICAPMRGHGDLLGMFYIDTSTQGIPLDTRTPAETGRLTDADLKSVVAIARQTALAVEARRFQDALLKAERFAAMGQTIAVLSHHIKNILQGVRGASFLIEEGLKKHDEETVRRGWQLVERNQNRIYDLVMDMLAFGKEREPECEEENLNSVVGEVIELTESVAREAGVSLAFSPNPEIPSAMFDREGLHRAVLNVVGNAVDACREGGGSVEVSIGFNDEAGALYV
ncbi:MAG: FHA domain-containing protein, partial [Planctomycetaceae bacterium]|nr:FHA domain-containing protein [Planctomycetaceae bacterium]